MIVRHNSIKVPILLVIICALSFFIFKLYKTSNVDKETNINFLLNLIINFVFIFLATKAAVAPIKDKLDKPNNESNERKIAYYKLRDVGIIPTTIMNKALENNKAKEVESLYEKELEVVKKALKEIKEMGLIDENEYQVKEQRLEEYYNGILER